MGHLFSDNNIYNFPEYIVHTELWHWHWASISPLLQIVPFLALGLGVDNIFLLTHTYAEQEQGQKGSHSHYQPNVSVLHT
jgi:hypothetical protein